MLTSPKLYVDWIDDEPMQITWNSFGNDSDSPVQIDLYRETADGPQFWMNIAPSAADDGSYSWIAADSGVTYGTYGLLIQISLVGNPNVFDRSTETFTVPEDNNSFYVSPDGSNRNDGKLPSSPSRFQIMFFASTH